MLVFSLAPQPVHADLWDLLNEPKEAVLTLAGWVAYFFLIFLMGKLATYATGWLVYTAQLNNFTDLQVIIEAWQVVRDLSNMFFIVILLVIAFGTLFRLEAYSWKKLLPKMVLAAILVNYSRAICGVIVDASQIVMLTFVAAIKDAASVGLAESFQLGKLLQLTNTAKGDIQTEDRLLAIVAAGVMLATMFTVQCVYIVVLIGRLVMIWFLTVLSPIAYVSRVLPQTERYASQWWEMFTRYVVVGPLCMFFLWLAMFIAARSVESSGSLGSVAASAELKTAFQLKAEANAATSSGAGALDTSVVAGFVISTLMLMAGMKLAQENASELGGQISKVEGLGKLATFGALAYAGAGAATTLNDKLYQRTGVDLDLRKGWERIQHKRHELSTQRRQEGYSKAMTKAREGKVLQSLFGAQDFAYEQYMPIVGKQGIGLGPKGLIGRRLYGNSKYQSLKGDAVAADKAVEAAKDEKGSYIEKFRKRYTDVNTQQKKLAEIDSQAAEVRGINENGNNMDMANSNTRALLEKVLQEKKTKRDEAIRQGKMGDARNMTNQMSAIQNALKEKGKINLDVSGGLDADIGRAKTERLKELGTQREDWQDYNAATKKGKLTKDTAGNIMATADDLNQFMKSKSRSYDQAIAKAAARKKAVDEEVHRYSPVIDYEGTAALEKVIAEEMRKYGKDDDEETLIALLKDKVHEKKGLEVLGIMRHMAAVGHDNEIPAAFGMHANVANMKKIQEQLVSDLKVDREAVMSTFNQMSLDAKRNNHQWFAEVITTKNGEYTWRSDEERNARNYGESLKRGHEPVVKGNRLALGGYTDDGVWTPDPGMLRYFVQNLPGMNDDAIKGRLNPNQGSHIFGDDRIVKTIDKLIDVMHSDEASRSKARDTMKRWKESMDKGVLDKGFDADHAIRQELDALDRSARKAA
jgi:hypothetical protein